MPQIFLALKHKLFLPFLSIFNPTPPTHTQIFLGGGGGGEFKKSPWGCISAGLEGERGRTAFPLTFFRGSGVPPRVFQGNGGSPHWGKEKIYMKIRVRDRESRFENYESETITSGNQIAQKFDLKSQFLYQIIVSLMVGQEKV